MNWYAFLRKWVDWESGIKLNEAQRQAQESRVEVAKDWGFNHKSSKVIEYTVDNLIIVEVEEATRARAPDIWYDAVPWQKRYSPAADVWLVCEAFSCPDQFLSSTHQELMQIYEIPPGYDEHPIRTDLPRIYKHNFDPFISEDDLSSRPIGPRFHRRVELPESPPPTPGAANLPVPLPDENVVPPEVTVHMPPSPSPSPPIQPATLPQIGQVLSRRQY
jgi:hypothetical protein